MKFLIEKISPLPPRDLRDSSVPISRDRGQKLSSCPQLSSATRPGPAKIAWAGPAERLQRSAPAGCLHPRSPGGAGFARRSRASLIPSRSLVPPIARSQSRPSPPSPAPVRDLPLRFHTALGSSPAIRDRPPLCRGCAKGGRKGRVPAGRGDSPAKRDLKETASGLQILAIVLICLDFFSTPFSRHFFFADIEQKSFCFAPYWGECVEKLLSDVTSLIKKILSTLAKKRNARG